MFTVIIMVCVPSSIPLDITEVIVGLVASCIGALVDNVMTWAGGGLVGVGGRVFIGGLVTVACVTK